MFSAAHHSCLCGTGIGPVNKRSDIDMMVLNGGDEKAEYSHGDTGAGLGASHQTGWTGVVAKIIQTLGYIDEAMLLEKGIRPAMTTYQRPSSEKKNEELNHGMAETPNYL